MPNLQLVLPKEMDDLAISDDLMVHLETTCPGGSENRTKIDLLKFAAYLTKHPELLESWRNDKISMSCNTP